MDNRYHDIASCPHYRFEFLLHFRRLDARIIDAHIFAKYLEYGELGPYNVVIQPGEEVKASLFVISGQIEVG